MLNIHDLEKRWKIYKIKSFLPYFLVVISLLAIIPIVYNFYTNKDKGTSQKKVNLPKKHIQKQVLSPQPKPKPIMATTVTTKEINKTLFPTIKPSMNFMSNIQHQLVQPHSLHQKTQKKQRKIIKEKPITQTIQETATTSVSIKKEPKINITIERKETQNDIFEIIKRFKKNKNPALSLFVAKKYYELGNYKQAYNYALITNQINSNIEASWIIFAKSLMQLHQKTKAVHILQAYIKNSHSSNAEILLNEIKSGKFK